MLDFVQDRNRLRGILAKLKAGGAPDEKIDLPAMATPEFEGALRVIYKVLSGAFGNVRQTLASPDVIGAFNTLYSQQIKRGIGEKLPNGDTIVDKSISRVAPSPDGTGLVTELAVTARKPDGSTYTYLAPRTEGSSAELMVFQVKDIIQNFIAQANLYAYFRSTFDSCSGQDN